MSVNTLGTAILGQQTLDLLNVSNCNITATIGSTQNTVRLHVYNQNLPYAHSNYQYGISKMTTSNAFYITANNNSLTRIGIGTTIADTTFEVVGTDALLIPIGSIDQRPLPKKGYIRYNNELDLFEGYGTGDAWVSFSGVKNRDQSSRIEAELFPGSFDQNIRFFTSNTERLRIDPGGNIGIGTTSPKVRLEIYSTDALLLPHGNTDDRPQDPQQGYVRYNTDTSQFEGFGAGNTWGSLGGVKSTDQTTYISAELSAGTNDSNLRFITGNRQHMIITPSGNVGIGTTQPNTPLHMMGDLIVSGVIKAGDYQNLYRVTETYETVPLSNVDPISNTRTIRTNDPNPDNRILYDFITTGGRFFVNGTLPYRNKTSLIAFDTTNWASIGLYRLAQIPGTLPAQFYPFTNETPATQLSPITIHTDEKEYMTHSFNFFMQQVEAARYVVAITGKGHELEIGGPVSDPNLYVIPIKGLGYDDVYDTRRAIQLAPFRFTCNIPTSDLHDAFDFTVPGNMMPGYSSNSEIDYTVDLYLNGIKKQGSNVFTPYVDYYWSNITHVDPLFGQVASTTTKVYLSAPFDNGVLEAVLWPTVYSEEVYAAGYFYQNAARFGKLFVDFPYGNIGIGTTQTKHIFHVEGDSFLNGTITTSNLIVLGESVTLNTITSNTEQLIITNMGTGPALQVTQTGPRPIADFYDDNNAIALRIADGGAVGIGTFFPQQKLHVMGGVRAEAQILGDPTDSILEPSYSWTTDESTGMYHPANSEIGFVTNTNERIRIKSNGNLGIGTTNPLAPFHFVANSAQNGLILEQKGAGEILSIVDQGTQRLVMSPSGNIGIGTNQTPYKLTLMVDHGDGIRIGAGTEPYQYLELVRGNGDGATMSTYDSVIRAKEGLVIQTTLDNGISHLFNTQTGMTYIKGNVGIGTTTPIASLHLDKRITIGNALPHANSTVFQNAAYQWGAAAGTNPASDSSFREPSTYQTNIIRLDNASTGTLGYIPSLIIANANGTNGTTAGITFAHREIDGSITNAHTTTSAGIIAHKVSGVPGGWTQGAMTMFVKNNQVRVDAIHIQFNGNVGIGTTNNTHKLRVEGNTLINSDLFVTGDITGFYQLSDQRIKTNITPISSALDSVLQLRPVTFKWGENVIHASKRGVPDVGLIAQEVEKVIPLVTENMNFPSDFGDLKGIQYPKLIPYLIRAIQELNQKVQTLQAHLGV